MIFLKQTKTQIYLFVLLRHSLWLVRVCRPDRSPGVRGRYVERHEKAQKILHAPSQLTWIQGQSIVEEH